MSTTISPQSEQRLRQRIQLETILSTANCKSKMNLNMTSYNRKEIQLTTLRLRLRWRMFICSEERLRYEWNLPMGRRRRRHYNTNYKETPQRVIILWSEIARMEVVSKN